MKDLEAIVLPQECSYAESHEWARQEGDQVKVGISDYAQDQLGDIVLIRARHGIRPDLVQSRASGTRPDSEFER